MRQGQVAATVAVGVSGLVTVAGVSGRAGVRIAVRDLEAMLVDVIPVSEVQVTVVKVVRVVAVLDGWVRTLGAMRVSVVRVSRVFHAPILPDSATSAAR
jgi:hypothetical protein